LLKKSLYGLVQSTRQFFKKLVAVLKSIGFSQSTADPCLLMKKDEALELVVIVVYADDCYAIGHEPALQETIHLIQLKGL
jgi:Reverse transcriptase (RNA-dependent DNA polymerase)